MTAIQQKPTTIFHGVSFRVKNDEGSQWRSAVGISSTPRQHSMWNIIDFLLGANAAAWETLCYRGPLQRLPRISEGPTTLTWGRKEREIREGAICNRSSLPSFCGFVLIWVYKCVFFSPKLLLHIQRMFALGVLIPCSFQALNVFHGVSC